MYIDKYICCAHRAQLGHARYHGDAGDVGGQIIAMLVMEATLHMNMPGHLHSAFCQHTLNTRARQGHWPNHHDTQCTVIDMHGCSPEIA